MVNQLLLIGLGGALGSMLRYLTATFLSERASSLFPYGTLAVNVVGCFLIGVVFVLSGRYEWLSPSLRLFLTVGFCGGYTTFSAFSYENIRLLQEGNYLLCGIYIVASVSVCLVATFLGMLIAK